MNNLIYLVSFSCITPLLFLSLFCFLLLCLVQLNVETKVVSENLFGERSSGTQYRTQTLAAKDLVVRATEAKQERDDVRSTKELAEQALLKVKSKKKNLLRYLLD